MTVPQFIAVAGVRWREQNTLPTCLGCDEPVHPVGANNPAATQHFDHFDARGGAQDSYCALRRQTGRFASFHVDDLDVVAGRQRRARFLHSPNLVLAYAFLSRATLHCCSRRKFAELVVRADQRRIWSYVGLQDWAVPFILLSLGDFKTRESELPFHFVLSTSRGEAQNPWRGMRAARLVKHFSDSGKEFEKGPHIKLSVSASTLSQVAGDLTNYAIGASELTSAVKAALSAR